MLYKILLKIYIHDKILNMKKVLNIFKNKYDCVFSMGSVCFSAELLTKAKLRVFASPFDWLCRGTFEERGELICNDFKDFFNIEDLEKIGEREYPENCDIYKNNHNGIIFNHDFTKGEELAKNYQKVKDKYDNRINKLNEKLTNSQKSLIVYMELIDELMKKDEEIIPVIEKINKKFDKTNIDILYIKHNKEMKDKEYKISQISKNAYVAELYNKERDNDGSGNYKNCNKLLSKIKIHKTFREMLLKISKGRTRVRVYLFGIKIMSFKVGE